MLYATKSSPLWKEIRNKVETNLTKLNSLQNRFFFKIISTSKSSKVYDKIITKHQYEIIINCGPEFDNILQDLNFIKSSFCYREYEQYNSLLGGIEEAQRMVTDLLNSKDEYQIPDTSSNCDIDTYEKKTENLRKKIQLCIQKIYKSHIADKDYSDTNGDVEINPIRENHLKDELLKSLDEDVTMLDMKNVSKRIFGLINLLMKSNFDNESKKK